MTRVLVTGGAGFIGSHVAERFLEAGYGVVALDDLSTGSRENLPAGVDLQVMDVGSAEAADLVTNGGFDVIAHLAAQVDVRRSTDDPGLDARTNILGTLNVAEAARRLPATRRPRFIFASTGGALYGGDAPVPSTEETPANPDAPYGVAKLAAELYLAYYARVWDMDTAVLRFGNVYGPRQNPEGEAGVIAIFARRIALGEPVIVYGTGEQTRDFVYVGDVAEAFLAAAAGPLPAPGPLNARALNVGTGVDTSVLELITRLGRIAGVRPQVEFRNQRPGEVMQSLLSADRIGRLLDWRATVDLDEGLARTYSWVTSSTVKP
jgi:UDP-glucose 4-epimerase